MEFELKFIILIIVFNIGAISTFRTSIGLFVEANNNTALILIYCELPEFLHLKNF